jgi:ABC-type transport system involved in multi-copper enzyme maturation permease subunit
MNKMLAVAVVAIKELYRRKDFYVLFVLTAVITLLLASINLFNEDRIVRYLKEVCLLLIWVSTLVIATVTAARQIPGEIESRTLFPLLAKPIGRSAVLLGKFAGCWLACGLALLVFYVFFGVLSASREHTLPVMSYVQVIWMHWVFLALIIALSLLGSLIFAAPSSNATILLVVTVGILLVGQHLNKVAVQMSGVSGVLLAAIYYAIPHLEFYDLRSVVIHNWAPRDWGMILLATLYGGVYCALVLVGACALFRRRVLIQ